MGNNPLTRLHGFGQSVWLDLLRRSLVANGELRRFVEEDDLRGVTSNPKIFDDAIEGSGDYDRDIATLATAGKSVPEIYESLAISDIQHAADVLRAVYDREEARDGYVSLEVNPNLAYDTEGTLAEARRLWRAVDRPNICIKIPATRAGIPAIEQCIVEGININVTLLFGLQRYREVAEAYIRALEHRAVKGQSVKQIASVASFFLSRIDALVDPQLERIAHGGGAEAERAKALTGHVAIANAKLAYQIYKLLFTGERFRALAAHGAQPQRVLWASTGTKNPAYSDVLYVDSLIGADTVNTMPLDTLTAYRDHGKPAARVEVDVDGARQVLNALAGLGIDLDKAAEQLEEEGVRKFIEPFEKLLKSLEAKQHKILTMSTN